MVYGYHPIATACIKITCYPYSIKCSTIYLIKTIKCSCYYDITYIKDDGPQLKKVVPGYEKIGTTSLLNTKSYIVEITTKGESDYIPEVVLFRWCS